MTQYLIVFIGCALAGSAAADVAELRALQAAQREVAAGLDTLGAQRLALVEEAKSLSDLISGLKRSDSESAELGNCILSSMGLVGRLDGIDHETDILTSRRDSLTDRLRAAYDWEISTLFKILNERPDEGLLDQLIIFQEERFALGDSVVASRMRYAEEMAVEATDGPEELHQKIELLEGKSGLLQQHLARLERRIRRFEEESRMAAQVATWVGQLMAVRPRAPQLGQSVRPMPDRSAISTPETRGQEMTRAQGRELSMSHYIVLEIRKLHARREEARQMKAIVDERIGTFRIHLQKLLEDRD